MKQTLLVFAFLFAVIVLRAQSSARPELSVFPNPTTGLLTIRSVSEADVLIVNELGKTVKTLHLISSHDNAVDVSDLASGIYFVTGSKNGEFINQKLVVTH